MSVIFSNAFLMALFFLFSMSLGSAAFSSASSIAASSSSFFPLSMLAQSEGVRVSAMNTESAIAETMVMENWR